MITIYDAREATGYGVVYDPGHGRPKEDGEIVSVSQDGTMVHVHYRDDMPLNTKATRPDDLSWDTSHVFDKTYGVLFSHASTMVYPELVGPERFTRAVFAAAYGLRIDRIQGIEHEVMERIGDTWRSRGSETPLEVIRRRWRP